MDYKQQVINSADQKHQDLLSDQTPPVVRPDLKVESTASYSEKRKHFLERVATERKSFNSAIDTSKSNSEMLGRDSDRFRGVITTTVILIILMGIILGAYYGIETFGVWMDENLIPDTDLEFAFSDDGFETMVGILGVIFWIVLMFTVKMEGCLLKLVVTLFVGGLIGALASALLTLIIYYGGYALYYILQPIGIMAMGGVAAIIDLIVGRKLESDRYKKLKWLCCLLCAAAGVVTSMVIPV